MCGICMNIVSGFDCKQRIARRGRGGGGVGFKGVVEEEERQRQKKILQEKERW